MNNTAQLIPATILTGFLGSGKTTLLNHILQAQHGRRIAVIENEFGEAGIDNEILLRSSTEQIVEVNNGCICCTVRGDLTRILAKLSAQRRAGTLDFERVVIETTGLADPAPVAQTFIVEDKIANRYVLDGIVTVVDAKHAPGQLDRHHEAQEQVGFADRILLSKTDLVPKDDVQRLIGRVTQMNPRAVVRTAKFGQIDIADVLDIKAFDLEAVLAVEPDFLTNVAHDHDDEITSFVYRDKRPFHADKLMRFLGALIEIWGMDLLRYKGVLNVDGKADRVIFQGVHLMMEGIPGRPWQENEERESVMVFIGRNLPRSLFDAGLALCVAGAAEDPLNLVRGY